MVRQLHTALTVPKHFSFNQQAEASVPVEQQSIAERQEEEAIHKTNTDLWVLTPNANVASMTKDEQVAHWIHAALKLQAEALEQQSIAELQKEEPTELKQTNADTTQGGFEPGQCIVCEKPT